MYDHHKVLEICILSCRYFRRYAKIIDLRFLNHSYICVRLLYSWLECKYMYQWNLHTSCCNLALIHDIYFCMHASKLHRVLENRRMKVAFRNYGGVLSILILLSFFLSFSFFFFFFLLLFLLLSSTFFYFALLSCQLLVPKHGILFYHWSVYHT